MKFAGAAAFALAAALLPATGWSQAARPDAGRMKLARDIFEAQGGAANMRASLAEVEKSLTASLSQTQGARPEVQKAVVDAMDKTIEALIPRMVEQVSLTYAANFDDRQLHDILAFYQSPAGRALSAKMPEITRQSVQAMSRYRPAIQVSMLDAVCSRTACPQQVLDAVTKARATIPADARL